MSFSFPNNGGLIEWNQADPICTKDNQRKWAKEVLLAVQNLRSLGVVHGDIRPANIYVHKGTGSITLGGFSYLGILNRVRDSERTSVMMGGDAKLVAPEMLSNFEYSLATDMWGLGATLYRMQTKNSIWTDKDITSYSGSRRTMRPDLDKNIKEVSARPWAVAIKALLVTDPKERPSIDDVARLPLFA
jgi:serine/threonine protein kinase